jgi:hypothetical protein
MPALARSLCPAAGAAAQRTSREAEIAAGFAEYHGSPYLPDALDMRSDPALRQLGVSGRGGPNLSVLAFHFVERIWSGCITFSRRPMKSSLDTFGDALLTN